MICYWIWKWFTFKIPRAHILMSIVKNIYKVFQFSYVLQTSVLMNRLRNVSQQLTVFLKSRFLLRKDLNKFDDNKSWKTGRSTTVTVVIINSMYSTCDIPLKDPASIWLHSNQKKERILLANGNFKNQSSTYIAEQHKSF